MQKAIDAFYSKVLWKPQLILFDMTNDKKEEQ